MSWLDGLCEDKPIAVWAESEGPGDDLRIELEDDRAIEVQVKKGLVRGEKLWTALFAIAKAIHTGAFPYGLLVVASDTSKSISEDLAVDIERLGQGRTDSLTPIGKDWSQRLQAANIPVQTVCQAMRIRVVHGLSFENTSVLAAKDVLRYVCAKSSAAEAAWNLLCQRAVQSIAKRGRWTLQNLVYLLKSEGITIRDDEFPASLLDRHTEWVAKTHEHFTITGVPRKIPIAHLLTMQLEKSTFEREEASDISTALQLYHSSRERDIGSGYDSVWAGRFRHRGVVVAGPGLGKSTMIKELAHQYALDGFVVVSAALKPIAAGMAAGGAFYDLLMSQSLSGSGISPEQISGQRRLEWVVLLDGLDECGSEHTDVAEHIHRFAQGHPKARIIVTTRPIGYSTTALCDWGHYRLLPPVTSEGATNIAMLVTAIKESVDDVAESSDADIATGKLSKIPPKEAISNSPQLLGMSAALVYRHKALPQTRFGLYSELMKLYTVPVVDRARADADVAVYVLDIIGWHLVCDPLISLGALVERSAATLSPVIGKSALMCRTDVRAAVAHWERVGLVERVYPNGTELLTFIHKTFCEFVAARFATQHSTQFMTYLIERPDLWEVKEFSIAMGLADDLVGHYLERHADGATGQLQEALRLLQNEDILISDCLLTRLTRVSFDAVEDGTEGRFEIGGLLSQVGKKAFQLVAQEAALRLDHTDMDVRLIAWGAIITCDASHYDAESITRALREQLPGLTPFSLSDLLDSKAASNRELIQRLAMGALKAQPDDHIESFILNHLGDRGALAVGFLMKVNDVLRSRGIKELTFSLSDPREYSATATVMGNGIEWNRASQEVCRSVASAFAQGDASETLPHRFTRGFPQFSALMHASGFMHTPGSDVYNWLQPHDEIAAHSVIRLVARLLPLNLFALAEEARELLGQLDADSPRSMFKILAHLDVPPLAWDDFSSLRFEHGDVIPALLHESIWISRTAADICKRIPMSRSELELALGQATGVPMRNIIMLVEHHHPGDIAQILVHRLEHSSAGDISGLFRAMCELEIPATPKLIGLSLACLRSDSELTVDSAAKLLGRWLRNGVQIEKNPVAQALEHWDALKQPTHPMIYSAPIKALEELMGCLAAQDSAMSGALSR